MGYSESVATEPPRKPPLRLDSTSDIPEDPDVVYVDPLFAGRKYETEVWLSERAADELEACDESVAFREKLELYAQAGFRNKEGKENSAIRAEKKKSTRGVFRVWHKSKSRWRLLGFYEDDTKSAFIGMSVVKKSGNDYTRAQWKRMEEIAEIKASGKWAKRGQDDESN